MSKMLLKNIENGDISLEKSEQETLTEMAENGRMLEIGQYVTYNLILLLLIA
jgi:hypothetical protein